MTLLKIKKKYGLIQEEIIDEKNKQRLSYENLQKKFILIEKLNDIQYQKDILELQKQNQKRKCLLKSQFLNHFYSTYCTVNMIELTNTRQSKFELVVDYINRWRTL
ncbi:MAG: hypothetical protein Q8842_03405, partial [Candidatus Phytoplasma australasiaticum]|nr:hypothetical protein [Candidatus Phytoplasma australasiaticum]